MKNKIYLVTVTFIHRVSLFLVFGQYLLHASDDRPIFVVVDGTGSSGRCLTPLLRASGFDVVHIHSKNSKAFGDFYIKSDYVKIYDEPDNLDTLADQLSEFRSRIRAIIPGDDDGVDLAEELNLKLGMPLRNAPYPFQTRRDKFYAQQLLKENGLRSISQIRTADFSEAQAWLIN